jgi:hypothetical protein
MALGMPFQTACRYQDKAAGALSALDNGAQKMCAERIFRCLRRRKIKCRYGNPALAQNASLREARSKVEPSDRHARVNEAAKGGRVSTWVGMIPVQCSSSIGPFGSPDHGPSIRRQVKAPIH